MGSEMCIRDRYRVAEEEEEEEQEEEEGRLQEDQEVGLTTVEGPNSRLTSATDAGFRATSAENVWWTCPRRGAEEVEVEDLPEATPVGEQRPQIGSTSQPGTTTKTSPIPSRNGGTQRRLPRWLAFLGLSRWRAPLLQWRETNPGAYRYSR